MNDFDKHIKDEAAKEQTEIPDCVKSKIEETLNSLPEKSENIKHIRILPRIAAVAACIVFVTLFLLPNVSVTYANALEQIPVIGSIVRVITVRNYFYSDGNHEMDIKVPGIEATNSDAADYINKSVNEMTAALVKQFYKDLELSGNNGYGSIKVDYEVMKNTERWFTLKLTVTETAASSNSYFVFYHIDKKHGKIVRLGDLFKTDRYSEILASEIRKQMKEQMTSDKSIRYWLGDSIIGEDFVSVNSDRNYYWNNDGDLVIVFDKYEVGPGSMGAPEFTIGKNLLKSILKPEYKDIII